MNTLQHCFAIKEISTGKFLPQHEGKGHTNNEPTNSLPPRLFTTHKGAATALSWWLKGKHYITYTEPNNKWEEEWDRWIKATPVLSRKKENMKIVEIRLEEVQP